MQPDSLLGAPKPWSMPKLTGKSQISSFRYKKKFSLDIAQSQINQDPIFGTSGGAQLAFSDMLGNDQYYFLIYNTASSQSEILENFNVAVTKVNLKRRANTAYGLYHFAGNYYNFAEGFFYERRYGGFASVSYPLSVFRRIEASINIRKSDRQSFGLTGDVDGLLVSNFISYTKDNSLWGASGPMDGERFTLSIGNTLDIHKSNTNFLTIIADYRKYFRLGQQVSYATRLWTAMNRGKGAELYRFFMGGSWDLRLYPRWRIWGKNLFLVSQELRVPFIERFNIAFPFGGIGFSSIRGALFFDLGNAWDDRLTDILGATGFGARLRLGGFLVLRYDLGRRFTIRNIDQGFSFDAIKVQPEWQHRFFFGWDF
ncbi:MAG: BamA/TamA family outer membrane protein [bacterium]